MRPLLTATLLLVPILGYTQDNSGNFYAGVSAGVFSYRETVTVRDFGAPFGVSDLILFEDHTHASRLYGGYRITDRWSLEAGYSATGSLGSTDFFFDPVLGDVDSQVDWDYEFLSVRALWTGRFGPQFSLFAGGGLVSVDSSIDVSETSACCGALSFAYADRDDGATATFGMEWAFRAVTLRGEWELFFLESDLETDVLSIGLKWEF
jgi:hypothetical protein